MKIALLPLEQWDRLNERLKSHFACAPGTSVRIYKGLAHAVFETAQGTAQFLSHKRSLAVVKGQTPYFDSLLPYFYKEVFGVQTISHLALQNPEEWVNSLKKDTNFVLFAEDHPVTGELYDYQRLDEVLNEKKIFSFRISHFRHFYEPATINPYSARICLWDHETALVFCGERYKTPALMAPTMNWDAEQSLQRIQQARPSPQDEKSVREFETSLAEIAEPWLPPQTPRLFDRALLKFRGVNGEALIQRLHEKLQIPPSRYFETIDTTNLCRWEHFKTFNNWWEPKPSVEDLSCLLVIDSSWLLAKDFAKTLKTTYEELLAEQSW